MNKEEKLVREYFPEIDDINGNDTIEVLPLTLIDMLKEHESNILRSLKNNIQLPEFLYKDYEGIKIGYNGDTIITDEWNEFLNKILCIKQENP